MKFCKNLQQVIDLSDPAWAPYWLNYKGLKKLLKDITPELEGSAEEHDVQVQQRGDNTGETTTPGVNHSSSSGSATSSQHAALSSSTSWGARIIPPPSISKRPGEVAFFKMLHSEFKKAENFMTQTTLEFQIREERVVRGLAIFKEQDVCMAQDKWQVISKASYEFYKDLLLLETFAIMTYVGFSKILKKHDKVTGYRTCAAFMEKVVNKANFTHYPKLMEMIRRCERVYEELSAILVDQGKSALGDDERLFINMIKRMNEQVIVNEKESEAENQKDDSRQSTPPRSNQSSSRKRETFLVPDDNLGPPPPVKRKLVESTGSRQ
eukprot:Nitzschia sp. Nitz4//scaffold107_size73032//51277//52364//NITZ4_005766-RA/size73032-augustus-gene-0.102-mRNA-1//-1//CDS//3329532611//3943//frame0